MSRTMPGRERPSAENPAQEESDGRRYRWEEFDPAAELDRLELMMAGKNTALKLVLESGVVVYCDSSRIPYARLPNDQHRVAWPIRSARFRAYIAQLYHEKCNQFLSPAVLANTLAVLEGMAWLQEPAVVGEVALEDLLDGEPVARAVIELAVAESFEGTMTELWHKLARTAMSGGWLRPGRHWPQNARALSEVLGRLEPFFAHLGIQFERLPRASERRVRIRRIELPDHDEEAQLRRPCASWENGKPEKELRPADAHDAP